jgi:hypothetical protein
MVITDEIAREQHTTQATYAWVVWNGEEGMSLGISCWR